MTRHRRILVGAWRAAFALTAVVQASAQFTTRVGVDSNGVWWPDRYYDLGPRALSSDGRWLVYTQSGGAYRRDLSTGEAELVSVQWSSGFAGGGVNPSVSDDGRWVCFETFDGAIVPGDTNFGSDVFLRDMTIGATRRVSVNPVGGNVDGASYGAMICADGSTVVYESGDHTIAPGDVNAWYDVYAYDVATQANELVSVDPSGRSGQVTLSGCAPWIQDPCSWAGGCAVSGDGRFVAFATLAYTLIPGGTTPGRLNVFVRDRWTASTELVSADASGVGGADHSFKPAISADGRFVAFIDWKPTSSGSARVGLRDRQTGSLYVVDPSQYAAVDYMFLSRVSISGDGMWIGYTHFADDLVPGDVNGGADAFVTHWPSGVTRLLSRSTAGQTWSSGGGSPVALSWNASRAAFWGGNEPLVAGPPGTGATVYLRDERVASVPVVSYCSAKTNSLGCRPLMSTSGICAFTNGVPLFVTAQFKRSHQQAMMLWGVAPAAVPFAGGFACVQTPTQRTPLQNTGGTSAANDCTGTCSFLFTAQYAQSHGVNAGDTLYAQYWSRDPLASNARNLSLSDAIAFTWAP